MIQKKVHNHPWGHFVLYLASVLLPILALGVSTALSIPDSLPIVSLLLIISGIIATVVSFYTGIRDPGISIFCKWAHGVMIAVIAANLMVHGALTRDLGFAGDSVKELHVEQDRQHKMQQEAAQTQKELLDAQVRVLREDNARQRSATRAGKIAPPPVRLPSLPGLPAISAASGSVMAPQAVRDSYRNKVMWGAGMELAVALLASAILAFLLNRDADGNGIPDYKDRERKRDMGEFAGASEIEVEDKPSVGKHQRR